MLYAYFSLIFERISMEFGWYIGSFSSINPMNFHVRTPNVMVTVRQNNSSIHLHTSVHRDNKPTPVQSVSLDVSTKNSVDGPSRATIQSEGRPPCRVSSFYFYSNNDPTSHKEPRKQTTEPDSRNGASRKKNQLQPVEWETGHYWQIMPSSCPLT